MKIKGLIILGALCIVAGGVTMGIAYEKSGRDIKKITSNESFEEKSITFSETNSIDINVVHENLTITSSASATEILIDYYETQYNKFEFSNEEGKLSIKQNISKKPWYLYIGFHINYGKVEITLPEKMYDNITIYSEVSEVYMRSVEVNDLKISSKATSVELTNINVTGNLELNSNAGELEIKKATVTNTAIKTNASDIELNNFESTLTNIEGDALYLKISDSKFETLNIKSSALDLKLDAEVDKLIVKADTAEIDVELIGATEDYLIDVSLRRGECNVGNTNSGEKEISISCDNADVEIEFIK